MRIPRQIVRRLLVTTLVVWLALRGFLWFWGLLFSGSGELTANASFALVTLVVLLVQVDVRRAREVILFRNLGIGWAAVLALTTGWAVVLEVAGLLLARSVG